MCVSRRIVTGLIALLSVMAAHAQAHDSCEPESLMHQQRDEATIQRLEALWNVAISQGDTSFERCLLTADFVEILSKRRIENACRRTGVYCKEPGRKRHTPELPAITILIHGRCCRGAGDETDRRRHEVRNRSQTVSYGKMDSGMSFFHN